MERNVRLLAGLVSGQIIPAAIAAEAWPDLIPLAQRHGLAPMLFTALRQQEALSLLPEHTTTALTGFYARDAGQNVLAYAAAQEWSRRFADNGITALWLKGVPLGLMVYPEPNLRPMLDIDVLIAPQQIGPACALVERHTGRKTASLAPDVDRHARIQVGSAARVQLELHWGLVDLAVDQGAEDIDWFLGQQQPLAYDGVTLLTFGPEAHLLHLSGHAQILHGYDMRLLRYLDLHQLVTKTPALRWPLVVEQAVACGWSYAVEKALAITQACFGTPLPAGLMDELGDRRRATEKTVLVTRHETVDSRGARLLSRAAGMSWRQRWRYLLAFSFPPPTYMRSRYHIRRSWQVPFYYPYRWFDVAVAVVKTLAASKLRLRQRSGHQGEFKK